MKLLVGMVAVVSVVVTLAEGMCQGKTYTVTKYSSLPTVFECSLYSHPGGSYKQLLCSKSCASLDSCLYYLELQQNCTLCLQDAGSNPQPGLREISGAQNLIPSSALVSYAAYTYQKRYITLTGVAGYQAAVDGCISQGGALATLASEDEWNEVTGAVTDAVDCTALVWLDGTKVGSVWQWQGMAPGEGYWPWGDGEGDTGEDCTTVYSGIHLADVWCNSADITCGLCAIGTVVKV